MPPPKTNEPGLPLPDGATGFAGVIKGKVIGREGGFLVVEVTGVEAWAHSRAREAQSLVGRRVSVTVDESLYADKGVYANVKKFLDSLQPGELAVLDVSNRQGKLLTLLELTKAPTTGSL